MFSVEFNGINYLHFVTRFILKILILKEMKTFLWAPKCTSKTCPVWLYWLINTLSIILDQNASWLGVRGGQQSLRALYHSVRLIYMQENP